MRILDWDRFADELVYGKQKELSAIFQSMCVFDSLCNLTLAHEGRPFNRIIGPNIMFRYACMDVGSSDIRQYFPIWPESACAVKLNKMGEFIRREFLRNDIEIGTKPEFHEVKVKESLDINFVDDEFVVAIFGKTEECHAAVLQRVSDDYKIAYDSFFCNGISCWCPPSSIITIM